MVYLDLLLIGFGNVGRRFARLLQEKSVRLRSDYGLSWRVVGIATRHHGSAFDGRGLDVEHALRLAEGGGSIAPLSQVDADRTLASEASGIDLIRHATTDLRRRRLQHLVVVETTWLDIRQGQPAIDHVTTALRAGAHAVTANKGPVAFAYRELASIAEASRREFLFEGSVMDGFPIFSLVRDTLPVADITGFRGVINSTTNFILTAMEEGREFDEALADMQQAGIAEADSSFDVDGWDAAAKTAALLNVLMRGTATPGSIARTGIRGLTRADVARAAGAGRRLRLVASGERRDGKVHGRVVPIELDAHDPLARLSGLQNMLILHTDVLGELGIVQIDGGLVQTAYALVSDLVTIARRVGEPA